MVRLLGLTEPDLLALLVQLRWIIEILLLLLLLTRCCRRAYTSWCARIATTTTIRHRLRLLSGVNIACRTTFASALRLFGFLWHNS